MPSLHRESDMLSRKLCNVHILLSITAGLDICLVEGNQTSGLVEVNYNGEWRSVCDDYWTDVDADIACG